MSTEHMSAEQKGTQFSNVSPGCLIRMLLRNLWMVVAAALIFSMSASLYLKWGRTPVYRASMTYAVTSRETTYTDHGNFSASREVAAVMSKLIQTDVVLDAVEKAGDGKFTGTVRAEQVPETNLINVYVDDTTPEKAFRGIQSLKNQFPDLSDYVSQTSVVQVIRNPVVSGAPINGIDERRYTLRAGLLGGVLMVAVLVWISSSRETIQTREGARRLLDARIVGSISHERKHRTFRSVLTRKKKGLQVFAPGTSYTFSEQINSVCTRLEQENAAKGRKMFLITGVGENEGKSTVAGNVAAMLAMKGKKVALLDADLRKPAMFKFFSGEYKSPLPLNEMLKKPFSRENFLKSMSLHSKLGLYMLFPIGASKNPDRLLESHTMDTVLRQLRVFDYVIVDSPPMALFADAEILADRVDASLLVVREDYTPACDINDAADTLRKADSKFLGVILNDMTGSSSGKYGYGYGYGHSSYGYGYGFQNTDRAQKSADNTHTG